MPARPFKHLLSITLSILLIFILFITAWQIPPGGYCAWANLFVVWCDCNQLHNYR